MPTIKVNEIDKILSELVLYTNPELLKVNFKHKIIKEKHYNKEKTEKYYELISNIKWFLDKLRKYKAFFLYFYPRSVKIKKYEALEHHIHAYIEDLETLRNKLDAYICTLKNDLKKITNDKKRIEKEAKDIKDQIYKSFDNVSKNRNPHRHNGDRFLDANIIQMESATTMLENVLIKNRLTQEGIKKFNKRFIYFFKKGKIEWANKAEENYSQILGLTETVIKGTKEPLYKMLGIVALDITKDI